MSSVALDFLAHMLSALHLSTAGSKSLCCVAGEIIVGGKKVLFMDEISTGLDSATTFLITKCLSNFCHIMEGTLLVALLQPPPETYNLFDDVMLLSQGQIVFHGPKDEVLFYWCAALNLESRLHF